MIPLLFSLARAVLPPWGDTLVNIADRLHEDWQDVATAAKDGWGPEDDKTLSEAITHAIDEAPRPEGYVDGDSAKLASAAAVVVRWIVSSVPRKRRGTLFVRSEKPAKRRQTKP